MTVNQITTLANNMTDENVEASIILGFINNVIARINVTFDAILPLYTAVDSNYTAINDNWQQLLFVSYASYAIKANDGSLNEADRFRNEFETNFRLLEENKFKAIATAYRADNFGNMYYMNASSGINVGWFTKNTDGGF